MMLRREVINFLGLSALPLAAWPSVDQKKPYKFIVGFAAGGGTDILARLVAKNFEELSKFTAIVENKTGASGSIAAKFVANSNLDARNLLVTSDSHLIYPYTTTTPNYDPINDFVPIAGLAGGPQCLLVNKDSKIENLEDLIGESQKPGVDLTYATGGAGTLTHMVIELLKSKTDFKARHIPFRGSAPSIVPVMSGEIDLLSSPLGMVLPHIKSGNLKPLAVTSKHRSHVLPEVPAVAETRGFEDYEASSWVGILGPKSMAKNDVFLINSFIQDVTKSSDFLEKISANAWAAIALNADEFNKFIINENNKWRELINKNKIDFE